MNLHILALLRVPSFQGISPRPRFLLIVHRSRTSEPYDLDGGGPIDQNDVYVLLADHGYLGYSRHLVTIGAGQSATVAGGRALLGGVAGLGWS